MKAVWNNKIIAESTDTIVVEGNHYFPKESVNKNYLKESSTTTVCGWKGLANYYSLVVESEQNLDAAWYYSDPKPEAEEIRGRIAFWKGVQISD